MISVGLQDAINEQINRELYSAHLYLSMSAYFETLSLGGFAHWMRSQYHEEVSHAMKLFDFITDRDGRVVLKSIDQPPIEFESPHSVMRMSLDHEREITRMIDNLYELALAEKDYSAHVLLEWFVDEQVEEEKVLTEIVDHLKIIGDDGTGLLMMNARLGDRADEGGE